MCVTRTFSRFLAMYWPCAVMPRACAAAGDAMPPTKPALATQNIALRAQKPILLVLTREFMWESIQKWEALLGPEKSGLTSLHFCCVRSDFPLFDLSFLLVSPSSGLFQQPPLFPFLYAHMAAAATAAAGEKALQTFHDWCASEGVAFDREVRVCAKEARGKTKTHTLLGG